MKKIFEGKIVLYWFLNKGPEWPGGLFSLNIDCFLFGDGNLPLERFYIMQLPNKYLSKNSLGLYGFYECEFPGNNKYIIKNLPIYCEYHEGPDPNIFYIQKSETEFIGGNLNNHKFEIIELDPDPKTGLPNALNRLMYTCPGASQICSCNNLSSFMPLNLKELDFSEVDFKATTNLSGAILTRTILKDANLSGVDLRGATLNGTDFTGCDLTKTIFDQIPKFSRKPEDGKRTCFNGATLNYQLIGNDWSYLDLTNATIIGLPDPLVINAQDAILNGLVFSTNDKKRAMTDRNGKGCNFNGADLTNANFYGAELDSSTFNPSPLTNNKAIMNNTDLSLTSLKSTKFKGTMMGNDEGLLPAKLPGADLSYANFSGANMIGVDLSGTKATGRVDFSSDSTKLMGAQFDNADLPEADFGDAQLQNASFKFSNLAKATFQSSNCNKGVYGPTNFGDACLLGADFTNAQMDGTILSNALLSNVATKLDNGKITYICHPTILPDNVTTVNTDCPNLSNGPCTVDTWKLNNLPSNMSYDHETNIYTWKEQQ